MRVIQRNNSKKHIYPLATKLIDLVRFAKFECVIMEEMCQLSLNGLGPIKTLINIFLVLYDDL